MAPTHHGKVQPPERPSSTVHHRTAQQPAVIGEQQPPLRMRTGSDFSTKSTRGAFYSSGEALPKTESKLSESKNKRRHHPRKKPKPESVPMAITTTSTHDRQPSMADMADLAVGMEAGLSLSAVLEASSSQHSPGSWNAMQGGQLPETVRPRTFLETIQDVSSSSAMDLESPGVGMEERKSFQMPDDGLVPTAVDYSTLLAQENRAAVEKQRGSPPSSAKWSRPSSRRKASHSKASSFGGMEYRDRRQQQAEMNLFSQLAQAEPPPDQERQSLLSNRGSSTQEANLQAAGAAQYGSLSHQQHIPLQQRRQQREEMKMFSQLAQEELPQVKAPPQSRDMPFQGGINYPPSSESIGSDSLSKLFSDDLTEGTYDCHDRLIDCLNPNLWLSRGVKFRKDGMPYFDDFAGWTPAGFARWLLYNPVSPEFTSLQQFNWAVIIGVAMGIFTAAWKMIIEAGVEFVWKTVPEKLLDIGFFTNVDGIFPVYHYMWMVPTIFGGVLSYIFLILPIKIPDQNDWINNVHSRGVQDYRTFWTLFVLATLGMMSGLSLGPELPLILTAGMVGSWLGLTCRQSMLQARVMNLTAASAAVGGFFGFPMAGALFVIEVPHRMGLQYFEALSPATFASIVAVLTNRLVVNNDVTGYYSYPFLTATLPSEIFKDSIVYGLFGAGLGVFYTFWVKKLKQMVHDLFHAPHDEEAAAGSGNRPNTVSLGSGDDEVSELSPLTSRRPNPDRLLNKISLWSTLQMFQNIFRCTIQSEPRRAGVAGAVAGAVCGVVGIFVPHVMFWGEAQLQSLIDEGRTPLPVYGQGDEPTAALVAHGYCMIDPSDHAAVEAGFSIGCSLLITLAKIIHVGLSLGTGIVGGHFWGPLFIGCSASHLFTDCINIISSRLGILGSLADHPCVVILCTMGAAHVVTFRAHMAIMLILTLTISTFDPEDGSDSGYGVAGDYSAVFPLLVVSVFVSLMLTRGTVFYKTQRNRGDIVAVPEVLCEPGMFGCPIVVDYDKSDFGSSAPSDEISIGVESDIELASKEEKAVAAELSQDDIEKAFMERLAETTGNVTRTKAPEPIVPAKSNPPRLVESAPSTLSGATRAAAPQPPQVAPQEPKSEADKRLQRLDELLSKPMEAPAPVKNPSSGHRRINSAPVRHVRSSSVGGPGPLRIDDNERLDSFRSRSSDKSDSSASGSRGNLVRIECYGELMDHQPSLLDQARSRAATSITDTRSHRRVPSLPSGRPRRSVGGLPSLSGGIKSDAK